MNKRLTNLELIAYLLAFLLGLILRFARLGDLPLSDHEAALALQSLAVANGQSVTISPQPGYILFTSALFFLFDDANVLVRFWPALFGSLLVLAPLLFRRPFGKFPAILLAFALALDPGLTAMARQAGGSTWAIASLVFAAGFLINRSFIPAAVSFSLAILGGPSVWVGLGAALLATGVLWFLATPEEQREWGDRLSHLLEFPWRAIAAWALGAFLLAGSLFFFVPEGIGAAAGSFAEFARGWWTPTETPTIAYVMAVLAYAPLALVFGAVQGVRGFFRRDPVDQWLALFWLVSIVIILFMPGRSYTYLAWSMIPLWGLGVRGLISLRNVGRHEKLWVAGVASLYLVLLIFAWLSLLGLSHAVNPEDTQIRVISFVGALVLLIVTAILLAWGWNERVAVFGAGWGIAAALLIVLVHGSVAAAGLGASPETQLWRLGTPVLQADLLKETAQDLSDWQTGDPNSLDITVAGIDSPALQWLLRDFRQVRFETVLTSQVSPGMVVTAGEETPVLTTQYRGQDFIWTRQPLWSDFTPDTWWNWLAFQQAPAQNRTIILWARVDAFPGGILPAGE